MLVPRQFIRASFEQFMQILFYLGTSFQGTSSLKSQINAQPYLCILTKSLVCYFSGMCCEMCHSIDVALNDGLHRRRAHLGNN